MEFTLSNTERKRLVRPAQRIVQAYHMIEDGDRIAVGVSGGKDSSTLLYVLTALQRQLSVRFEIVPISLSLGFAGMNMSPLVEFVEKLGHTLHVKETEIGKVVFDIRQEKNPCSLCANMRRGTLYEYAKELDCNKAALGHHLDDAMETFFMNLLFNGKMGSFHPKTYLDRADITLIRPLVGIEEDTIERFIETRNIPIITNPCPANKKTKREEIKQLIDSLSSQYPDLRQKFLHAIQTADMGDFWHLHQA
ncbi:tRNA(Ile)-lysidine synthase TilS/MesJ [Aneurinibacillus soli]|uniref:tRNA 2-thiocytidine biosynthesis protein TtcA n=1 Tax=Aneurinibacillus soli TaxID=1500254 RepID=A0A0U4NBF8_9BACL|nr:ATP-binding protein [Aneurinibacillus soli]PYE61209.1 tRNA(Ile)-lysidine synthase TilS/MesJ [Aneurinibacillus soli]BAU26356.1 tRNA 2-thiocytidine biosynthesis protein TtcA [Aneurinibacillus soli]